MYNRDRKLPLVNAKTEAFVLHLSHSGERRRGNKLVAPDRLSSGVFYELYGLLAGLTRITRLLLVSACRLRPETPPLYFFVFSPAHRSRPVVVL